MIAVLPMAGHGSRFLNVGVSTPKPLIDVCGSPMYSWAVKSLPMEQVRQLIFICLNEHLNNSKLQEDIQQRYGHLNPIIIGLDRVTEGQADTVLAAKDIINCQEPIIIYNSDTYCVTSLSKTLPSCPASVAGILGVFKFPGEKWSFAKINEEGRVIETSEKKRISPWACTGLYYFKNGCEFVRHAQEMITANERINNEFYVAPVYNRMIKGGKDIRIDIANEAWVLGTPEDLDFFKENYHF